MVQDRVITISLLPPTMVGLCFIVVLKEISNPHTPTMQHNHSSIVQDIALTPTKFHSEVFNVMCHNLAGAS